LSRNPIYLRAIGNWGNPNPFFDKLSRYSPFVVMGAIVFGICTGVANPALFAGDDALIAFWCFLCLPGVLLNTLTLFGTFMAPALTAPLVSMEIDRGTWEILQVTPQPTQLILLAKMFGALGRLRIWPLLFALSMLQGLLIACSASVSGGALTIWDPIVGAAAATRPWTEVLFAGLAGMYLSTRLDSSRSALAASYAAVVIVKIVNSSGMWIGVFGLLDLDQALLAAGSVGPTIVYFMIVVGLMFGVMREAGRLSYG
jgi:hypothetical protein